MGYRWTRIREGRRGARNEHQGTWPRGITHCRSVAEPAPRRLAKHEKLTRRLGPLHRAGYVAALGSSSSINGFGRQCQLAQLCGESPLASRIVLSAPESKRNLTVSSGAYAAARCSGVSPRVRTSRQNASVATPGTVRRVEIGRASCRESG